MSASVPLTLVNSLQLAKQGDVEAIAALVNRALQTRDIRVVAASAEGDRLHLVLESEPAPDQELVIPFIRQSLSYLGAETIRRVVIYGKSSQQQAQWGQEIPLDDPPTVLADRSEATQVQSQREEARSQEIGSPESNGTVTVTEIPVTHLESLESGNFPVAISNKIIHQTAHGSVVNLAPAYRRANVRSRSVPMPANHLTDLLDRQLETEEAITTLQSGASVNFFGETGSGKTALLRSLAHHSQLAATFRDGVIYQRRRFHTADDVLQSVFDSFFEYDSDIPARPTLTEIRQAFQGRRALAVLDDLNLPPAEVAQIHSFPGLTLLSASHERHLGQGINAMPMLGLPLNDAVLLLEQGLGRSLTPDEQPHAKQLCNQVQGHPLRILQLAALARDEQQALAVIVERLRIAPSLDALTLKAAVSLPEAERRVLAALVVFDGVSIRAEHLAALTGLPNVQTVLATLTRRYLVLEDNSRYYLSRAIAIALRQAWDLNQWVRRVLTYFHQWLERQTQLENLLPELDVLLQVTHLAVVTQQHSLVLRLAEALNVGLMMTGRWGAWEQIWQWALQAGRSQRDPGATALALHQLGTRSLIVNDPLTAHTQLVEALQLRHSLGDRPGSLTTRHNLGLLLTLPMEVDPVAVTASPPALPPNRARQAAIVIGSLAMAIAGTLFLLNPFPKPASFSLSATRLGFGGQTLNTTSQVQTVQITNTGSTPLEITSVTPSGNSKDDFQISETCTAAPVAPQEDCTLEVTFTPQAEGDRLASVLILDRAGDNPQELILSGIGEPPTSPFVLSFAPGNVTFEPQLVGTQGKSQSIMVTNTGSEPVAIARVAISGNQASEFQSTTNCVNATLAPKQTCNVQVVFAPKALDNRRASLVIVAKGESDLLATGDLPDQPPPFWNIPLSGTGVAAAALSPEAPPEAPVETAPRVSLSLSELNFAPQGTETGTEKPLVIANTGTASLYIDELSIEGEHPGDFAVVDNTCFGGPILAEDGCIVSVRFSPTRTGLRRADLVIRDSASGSPRRIALSGVGVQRSPAPTPTPTPAAPTILNFAASLTEITPGESVQLCYGVSNATQVNIEGVGGVDPAAENCVTVQPSQTTTYNLSARNANGQEVTAQTTVAVVQPSPTPSTPLPDVGPPPTPQALSPGSRDRSSAPDLLSCPNSTPLTWQAGAGDSPSSEYRLTLQYLSDEQQDWITALEGTRSSGIDVAPLLLQYQSYEWRWMVRSLNEEGQSSEPSPWSYFTCYDLR